MLRILIIAPTMYFSDRGCHIRIYEQARALNDLGHVPTILTYHNGRDIGETSILRIYRTPWYNKLVAGPSLHLLYMDALLFIKSVGYAMANKVDIVHAHLHEGAFIAHLLSRTRALKGIPYLFDAQGSLTGEMVAHGFIGKNTLTWRYFKTLEKSIVRRSPFIITSSRHLRDSMVDDLDFPRNRIQAVPDGVDIHRFRSRWDRPRHENISSSLRREIGIPESKIVVVYLGGMDRHKGIFDLLDAIPQVLRENNKIHFLLMGYPGEENVKAKTEEIGIEKHVTVLGKISYPEAPRYLALGDIAVAPKILGWGEANGKLFNYMGCALPIVAYDHSVNREILGEEGTYAKMGDPASLAKGILELARDEDRRRSVGKRLRRLAVERYSWQNAAESIVRIYEKALF